MKRLLVFGDSWAEGSGLDKPREKTFGELTAEALGFDRYDNYAVPGTSISFLIKQLHHAEHTLDRHDGIEKTAIFFLTSPSRDFIFQPKGSPYQELHFRPEGGVDGRDYYKYFHTPELSTFRANTTLLALHQLCAYHKIDDYYIIGWERFDFWKGINKNKIYHKTCLEIFGPHFKTPRDFLEMPNEFVIPNDGHPNQKGDQEIAKWLTR